MVNPTPNNPWNRPQKRLELPGYKKLYPADQQDAETLQQFLNEPLVELYREPNDEMDYAVMNGDGSVTRVSECVTINGTQWWIFPGINRLPQSVYEFLMQAPHQGKLMPSLQLNQCLGNLGR